MRTRDEDNGTPPVMRGGVLQACSVSYNGGWWALHVGHRGFTSQNSEYALQEIIITSRERRSSELVTVTEWSTTEDKFN